MDPQPFGQYLPATRPLRLVTSLLLSASSNCSRVASCKASSVSTPVASFQGLLPRIGMGIAKARGAATVPSPLVSLYRSALAVVQSPPARPFSSTQASCAAPRRHWSGYQGYLSGT